MRSRDSGPYQPHIGGDGSLWPILPREGWKTASEALRARFEEVMASGVSPAPEAAQAVPGLPRCVDCGRVADGLYGRCGPCSDAVSGGAS